MAGTQRVVGILVSTFLVACGSSANAPHAHDPTSGTSGPAIGGLPGGKSGPGSAAPTEPTTQFAAADLPFDVLTQHGSSARTGGALCETALMPITVDSTHFGQVARLSVDGDVYAQPLYARNVSVLHRTVNALFVATEHNSVFAFDTNHLTEPPLWQVNLGPSMPMSDFPGETNFAKEIGITGTPVIDPNTGTIYVVSARRTVDPNGTRQYSHWLHALSTEDGSQRAGSPVQIAATVAGTGAESDNGTILFDSSISLQRTALLLYRGLLYFGASAHGYSSLYHGWLFGYDATTLALKSVMNTTSDSAQGGVWMAGAGPTVDDQGLVYVTTANGLNADPETQHQESLLQFTADANGFVLRDWFTAANWHAMDANDKDFGSTGVLAVPGTHMLVSGDKSGNLYFADSRHLEHLTSDDHQLLAKLSAGIGTAYYGAPVYYQGSSGPRVYAWAAGGSLASYAVADGVGPTAAVDVATIPGTFSMPGGVLSVSATQADPTSGVVWATATTAGDASGTVRPGTLYAFAADDLSQMLYSSDQVPARDALGNLGKFCAPTIADGHVYVATQSNEIAVYGLLTAPR